MTIESLLIISGVRGDTRRYRSIHLAEQARMVGMPVTLTHIWEAGLLKLAKNRKFDIVVFQRVEMDKFVSRLLMELKTKESLCLYDTDDLVFDPELIQSIDSPDFVDPIRFRLYRKAMERQRNMLLACDGVLVSTRILAEAVMALGKPVRIHHNAFSLEMCALAENAFAHRKIDLGRTVLGYATGTHTHDRDFALARDALLNILESRPEVELWLVGQLNPGSGWERYGDRVRQIPKVDWRELPDYLAQFDINLAPLVSGNPFSESKSAIKFMEAALLRCPTVASNCGEFKAAIEDGVNGLLVEENHWFHNLMKLVTDSGLRKRIGEKAFRDVMERYHPKNRCLDLVEALNELNFEVCGQKLFSQQVSPTFLDLDSALKNSQIAGVGQDEPNDFQRGWALLWRRGPFELLGNIWIFIRRLLEPLFPFRTKRKLEG